MNIKVWQNVPEHLRGKLKDMLRAERRHRAREPKRTDTSSTTHWVSPAKEDVNHITTCFCCFLRAGLQLTDRNTTGNINNRPRASYFSPFSTPDKLLHVLFHSKSTPKGSLFSNNLFQAPSWYWYILIITLQRPWR